MKQQFKQGFSEYACAEDTIETTVGKFIVVARIVHDEDTRIDDDEYYLREWYADEWFYCGIQLSVYYENENGPRIELDEHATSLWGLKCNYPGSNNSYLTGVANERLPEAIAQGRIALDSLRNVINN